MWLLFKYKLKEYQEPNKKRLSQICTDSYNTEAQYKQGVRAYLGYIGGPANLLQAVGGTVARVVT